MQFNYLRSYPTAASFYNHIYNIITFYYDTHKIQFQYKQAPPRRFGILLLVATVTLSSIVFYTDPPEPAVASSCSYHIRTPGTKYLRLPTIPHKYRKVADGLTIGTLSKYTGFAWSPFIRSIRVWNVTQHMIDHGQKDTFRYGLWGDNSETGEFYTECTIQVGQPSTTTQNDTLYIRWGERSCGDLPMPPASTAKFAASKNIALPDIPYASFRCSNDGCGRGYDTVRFQQYTSTGWGSYRDVLPRGTYLASGSRVYRNPKIRTRSPGQGIIFSGKLRWNANKVVPASRYKVYYTHVYEAESGRFMRSASHSCGPFDLLSAYYPVPSDVCYAQAVNGQQDVQLAEKLKFGPFWETTTTKIQTGGNWHLLRGSAYIMQYITGSDWSSYTRWFGYFPRPGFNPFGQGPPRPSDIKMTVTSPGGYLDVTSDAIVEDSDWADGETYKIQAFHVYVNDWHNRELEHEYEELVECRLVVYKNVPSFTADDISVTEPDASEDAEITVTATGIPSHASYRVYWNTVSQDTAAGDTATAGSDYQSRPASTTRYVTMAGSRWDEGWPPSEVSYRVPGTGTRPRCITDYDEGGYWPCSMRLWGYNVPISSPITDTRATKTETIRIPILADTLVEGDETFRVAFRPTLNNTDDGDETIVTVTIIDDDTPPPPAATVTDTVVDEGDVEHTILVPVVLTETPTAGSPVRVAVKTWVGEGDSVATAEAGVDYEAGSWTLSFTSDTDGNMLTVPVKVFGDTDFENDEFFYVQAGSASGKVTLSNDELPGMVWKPDPDVITPAGANPDGGYDYLVGSPVFVWLSNVAETCEPVTALPVLTGTDRDCGDDVWARDWFDSSLWDKTLVWQTGNEGQAQAMIYVPTKIVVDRGDGFAPHVCYSDHATNPTRRGASAPGRRLTYDRINLGLSNIQPGECVYRYYLSGEYTTTMQVVWNEYVCEPLNPASTQTELAANPKSLMTCGVPTEVASSFVQQVTVAELKQIVVP